MSRDLELVICTEKGRLEGMSKLLVSSLRTFGGKYKDLPIYSYQPRAANPVSADTKKFFEQNQVNFIDENLNKEFDYFPVANKIFACTHREQNSSAKKILFLDSDIIFLNEPEGIDEIGEEEILLRPVDNKGIGVTPKEFEHSKFWQNTLNLVSPGVVPATVRTTVDNQEILGYFNSGHVTVHRDRKIFSQWLEDFRKLMKAKTIQSDNWFYTEQFMLSVTIAKLGLKPKLLNKYHNYPLKLGVNGKISNPNYIVEKPEELVSIHYHHGFREPHYFKLTQELLANHPNGAEALSMAKKFDVNRPVTKLEKIKSSYVSKMNGMKFKSR